MIPVYIANLHDDSQTTRLAVFLKNHEFIGVIDSQPRGRSFRGEKTLPFRLRSEADAWFREQLTNAIASKRDGYLIIACEADAINFDWPSSHTAQTLNYRRPGKPPTVAFLRRAFGNTNAVIMVAREMMQIGVKA